MENPAASGIFFFHNPKAGGTSVNLTLRAMFADAAQCPIIENTQREHEQRAGEYAEFRGYAYYAGHYGVDIYRQVRSRHLAVTNFRHPAARLLSLYEYYRLKVTVPPDDMSRDALHPVVMAQTHDFHDFLAMEDPRVEIHTRNHHVRQLSGSAWAAGSEGNLGEAVKLVDSMAWFYICEKQRESQRWAEQVLGKSCGQIGWANSTRDDALPQRSISSIPPEAKRVIYEKNALDLALYWHASARIGGRAAAIR